MPKGRGLYSCINYAKGEGLIQNCINYAKGGGAYTELHKLCQRGGAYTELHKSCQRGGAYTVAYLMPKGEELIHSCTNHTKGAGLNMRVLPSLVQF